jgi:hypothetical protein
LTRCDEINDRVTAQLARTYGSIGDYDSALLSTGGTLRISTPHEVAAEAGVDSSRIRREEVDTGE